MNQHVTLSISRIDGDFLGFKDVFEKHKDRQKKPEARLDALVSEYILKFRKRKRRKTEEEEKKEAKIDDKLCLRCEGSGIDPKDKKGKRLCPACEGSGQNYGSKSSEKSEQETRDEDESELCKSDGVR